MESTVNAHRSPDNMEGCAMGSRYKASTAELRSPTRPSSAGSCSEDRNSGAQRVHEAPVITELTMMGLGAVRQQTRGARDGRMLGKEAWHLQANIFKQEMHAETITTLL